MKSKIKTFDMINILIMLILVPIMLYPIWHVIMASFSESSLLTGHTGLILKPQGFSVDSYRLMVKNPMIFKGYLNTIFIVVVGVTLNVAFTALGAYCLSRKGLYWQKHIMMLMVFTMYFSGGLIPRYLMITQSYHMTNSYWSLILPGLISTYNLIIMRTSFAALPDSLEESAKLDGAGAIRILVSIVIPLSMPVIAVMILYYAVGHWNAWFDASIYIKEREKFPLQLILREILIINDTNSMTQGSGDASDQMAIGETVKYAVIVVSTLPILCVYPFLQKYFQKGVMIGAVKG